MRKNIDLGLLVLRFVVGVTFAAHGWQKLFVFGLDGVRGAFAQMGVPLPGIMGPLIALLEFGGGVALMLGVLTRPIAALLAADMLVAIVLVRMQGGFFAPGGFEFEFTLMGGALALALAGAGAYSLDAGRARRRAPGSL